MKQWNEIVIESYDIPKTEVFLGIVELIEAMPEKIKSFGISGNSFSIDERNLKDLTNYLKKQGYKQKSTSGSAASVDYIVFMKKNSEIYITMNDGQTKATISF
jgi:hypothetical protein